MITGCSSRFWGSGVSEPPRCLQKPFQTSSKNAGAVASSFAGSELSTFSSTGDLKSPKGPGPLKVYSSPNDSSNPECLMRKGHDGDNGRP